MTTERFATIGEARAWAADHYPGAEALPALSVLFSDSELVLHRPTGTVLQITDSRDELDLHAAVTAIPAAFLAEQEPVYEIVGAALEFARFENPPGQARAAVDELADVFLDALASEHNDATTDPDRIRGFTHDRLMRRMRPLREQLLVLETIQLRFLRRHLGAFDVNERQKLLDSLHLNEDDFEAMAIADHRRFGTLT